MSKNLRKMTTLVITYLAGYILMNPQSYISYIENQNIWLQRILVTVIALTAVRVLYIIADKTAQNYYKLQTK